jgi:nicotinate-nucleotide adenylyltransferase
VTEKAGIMGGTFDPIHYGHLLAAEECRRQLGLDRVVFVPTGAPPHKRERPITPSEDRYAMTLLATAGVREFSVSRAEIDRGRPSHTVDTLEEFLAKSSAACEVFFITGLDALLGVGAWKDYMRLPSLCTLVTATRPGYSAEGLGLLPSAIRRALKLVEIPQFAISSTEIRERVRDGRSIRFLVPHLVETYIECSGLYRRERTERREGDGGPLPPADSSIATGGLGLEDS